LGVTVFLAARHNIAHGVERNAELLRQGGVRHPLFRLPISLPRCSALSKMSFFNIFAVSALILSMIGVILQDDCAQKWWRVEK